MNYTHVRNVKVVKRSEYHACFFFVFFHMTKPDITLLILVVIFANLIDTIESKLPFENGDFQSLTERI